MKFQVFLNLTADRIKPSPQVLWEGYNWVECKEKFNFYANAYRDEMDRIGIRRIIS